MEQTLLITRFSRTSPHIPPMQTYQTNKAGKSTTSVAMASNRIIDHSMASHLLRLVITGDLGFSLNRQFRQSLPSVFTAHLLNSSPQDGIILLVSTNYSLVDLVCQQ
jgi:hypothetical protein